MTESKKNLISALRGGGRWEGGEGGEGGDCGSGASIRISWVMVHRLQEADYSLHCSSAVDWGKGEKIRHYIVRAWGEGGGGGSGPGKFSRGCTASDQRPI